MGNEFFKFMVKKSGVYKFKVEKSGVEAWVEKSRVEISSNLIEIARDFCRPGGNISPKITKGSPLNPSVKLM